MREADARPSQPAGNAAAPGYYRVWNQRLFDLVPAHSRRILEVGCASGLLGREVKKRNAGAHYVGIELSAAAAEAARESLDEVHMDDVERFDWSRLAGRSFDCIIFSDVLEHLVDPERILRNAAVLLEEGGALVCSVPNVSHWSIIAGLIEGRWDYADSGLLDRTHLRFFTVATFRKLLAACGFRTVREDRDRTPFVLHPGILPLLREMRLDKEDFVERVTTFQLMVRAERIAKVTVIIPVFNKVELTRECLESIARHYPSDWAPQVLVIDNGSGDGTPEYLRRAEGDYPWLKSARSEGNLGFARACNLGAARASEADILVFLNNDTVVMPFWLEKMLERIHDEKVGMVGAKLIYPGGTIQHAGMVFDADAVPVHIHHQAGHGDPAVNVMMEYPAVTGACIMIKRGLFLELGGFDASYPMYYEDVDLCFKVREKGRKVIYQPASVVVHLEGRSSPSRQAIREHIQASRLIFFRKWKDFMLKDLAVDPGFYESGKPYLPARS